MHTHNPHISHHPRTHKERCMSWAWRAVSPSMSVRVCPLCVSLSLLFLLCGLHIDTTVGICTDTVCVHKPHLNHLYHIKLQTKYIFKSLQTQTQTQTQTHDIISCHSNNNMIMSEDEKDIFSISLACPCSCSCSFLFLALCNHSSVSLSYIRLLLSSFFSLLPCALFICFIS